MTTSMRLRSAAIAVACLWAVGVTGAQSRGAVAPVPGSAAMKPSSVRDSPGWVPNVDPESASVVIGRRLGAPLVRAPFRGGARSLDDLGRMVCRALHHDRADSLLALCVTESEFRDILWREFPQSRPATGLTWRDGWASLQQRLYGGCNSAVQDLGGSYYEFLRFEQGDSTARYKNFKLHNRLALVVKDDQGAILRFEWIRSVAERRGVFKIYSMRD